LILNYIYPIKTKVSIVQRQQLLNQQPKVIWFTGLSGSGKSTLAVQLEAELHALGFKTYLLDGDNIRSGINKDLSFTDEGRIENIRRIGEVSKLFIDAGVIVLSAFISPFTADREHVKKIVGEENYMEVFVHAPLEVCEQRDVKGLYKKARAGEVKNFTGIDSPYEIPEQPDIVINTHEISLDQSIATLLEAVVPIITLKK
jgi:adenylylsulfate kinase